MCSETSSDSAREGFNMGKGKKHAYEFFGGSFLARSLYIRCLDDDASDA